MRARVEEGIARGGFRHGIVVADAGWHEGVVGIVASRVTETFRRPAAVIALREDFGKGSVRSYGGKDVLGALRASAAQLKGFGGHKYAAGLSVDHDRLEAFAAAFDAALGEMQEDAASMPLYIEGACSIDELDVKTIEEARAPGSHSAQVIRSLFSPVKRSCRTAPFSRAGTSSSTWLARPLAGP